MADAFRSANIQANATVTGVESLIQANNYVDKLIEKMHRLTGSAQETGNSMHHVESGTSAFQNVNQKVTEVRSSIDTVKSSLNNMDFTRVSDLNDKFGKTDWTLRKTNEELAKTKENIDKIRPKPIDDTSESTDKLKRNTDEANHSFKRLRETAVGTFAGSLITNGIQSIGSGLESAISKGLKFNTVAQDMHKRWEQAGLTSSESNAMVQQIGQIRQHADVSAQSIMNMQKQYLTLTGSASQARDLTNTITSFGRESGMTDEQQSRVARLIASNNAVNARSFNRTLGQAPGFANEIIKQTGLSKQAFYGLLQSGKLTGSQLREAMIKASKDSNRAWSSYATTATGKMDMVKATIADTKKKFDSNLTSSMFNQISKIASKSGGLNKLQKNVEKVAQDVGSTIGNVIGSVVGFLARNIKPIEGIGKAIWNIVKGLSSGVWSAFTGIFSIFTSNTGKASGGLKSIDKVLTAISKHQTMIRTIGKLLVTAFAAKKIYSFGSAIGTGINAIRGFTSTLKAAKTAQGMLNVVMDANPFGLIALAISGLILGVVELYKRFKPFRKLVNGTFGAIKKAVSSWWKQIVKNFRAVTRVIGRFSKYINKHFGNVLKDQMRTAKRIFKVIEDVFKVFKDVFTGNWKSLGKDIGKLAGDLWKLVKDAWKTGIDFVEDLGKDMWNSIWGTFKSWGKVIGKFFVDLWQGIKNKVSDGINDVTGVINTGIKGLNWVLSKVGGSGHTIGLIPKVHLAQGTMDGKLPRTTMAMLNDGNDSPQTGNKELAVLPNGKAFIPQQRNWVGLLPKGTRVFNATQTRMLMAMRGIQHYSLGSFAHGLWDGAKHVAGDVASGFKKTANAIAHPIKFLKGLFGGLPKLPEYLTDLTSGMANTAKNSIVSWFKKFFGGMNNPAGSGVQRWRSIIEKASSFMNEHLSGSDINLILGRIAKESGGNPTITQKVSDVNSAAGHPAQGLLQYVPSTFASWAVKGHTNLLNGYDQLLAMFNDSNWRSDIANSGGWGPSGHRARKNGGAVSKGQIYQVNEDGAEYFRPNKDGKIFNHNDTKRLMASQNRPVEINYNPEINLNGTNITKSDIFDVLDKGLDEVADKLNAQVADEGGYIIG